MREIKFRAWINEEDPEYSRMVYSEQSIITALRHVYGGRGVATSAGFSDCDNQPHPERYVLMQYTGLKDKNGKEIYEGDILHWRDLSELSDGTLECNVRVFWDDEHLRWSVETLGRVKAIDKLYDYSNIEEIEIIGNIFEKTGMGCSYEV